MGAQVMGLGAVVASTQVAAALDNAEGADSALQHGVTYGGHPAVMTATLKNLEILERENLVDNADQMGQYLYDRARAVWQEKHPAVGLVGGGLGLLMSIELIKNRKTKEPFPGRGRRGIPLKMRSCTRS
ncbi:Putrescine--pyruvate aminotransferase [Candidatus Entotheonellaceae bacterium PAL068K]